MTAARPDTWMPIYWGDYARDTGHLNAAGHGAYLMMIKHYWCTASPLPNDDDELWRIACCDSKREWLKIRPKVARLFREDGGFLRHKRIDSELAKARDRVAKRSEAGKKGAQAKWQSDGNANGKRMANASDCQWQTDGKSQSHIQNNKKQHGASAPRDLDALVFDQAKSILGKSHGGKVAKGLLAHHSPAEALTTLDTAKRKSDPAAYLEACVRAPPKKMAGF